MLNLNWNNFGENLIGLVKEFRNDKDFQDVTLLCEDGQLVNANRFMLSCCSTFFKFVFKKAVQNNVVVYLKGVKGNHMKSILDFIYHGSTNVHENQLANFLETAHDLKIRGLVDTSSVQRENYSSSNNRNAESFSPAAIKNEVSLPQDLNMTDDSSYADADHVEIDENELAVENVDAGETPKNYSGSSYQHTPVKQGPLFQDFSKMSSASNGQFSCTICGKSFSYKHVLENHIETHMDNAYPCTVCNKIFKTRNSLKSHLSQKHRNPTGLHSMGHNVME